jgi:Ca2+-transporting ATPase
MDFYNKSIKDIENELTTDTKLGLTTEKVNKSLLENGYNKLNEQKKKSIFKKFIEQINDFMIFILIGASILGFFTGEFVEGALIILIVIINAVVGIIQENKAENALDAIKNMSSPHAKVIRNGVEEVVKIEEVVVGDIVVLEAGDFVPADLRLFKSISLKVDESALTGEAMPIEKTIKDITKEEVPLGDRFNMCYMGTVITYGRGAGIIISTGMNTEIGKIAKMLEETENEQTPLQKAISQFGKLLAIVCLIIVGIIFIITIIESLVVSGALTFTKFKDALMTSVALAVAAIPEGLPAIITIVLALGMQNLVKHKAIMKKLPAVETLGSTQIICSDKTGTLTQNLMTITHIYSDNKIIEVNKIKKLTDNEIKLMTYGVLCNDTRIVDVDGVINKIGDPTEIAFYDLSLNLKYNPTRIFDSLPRVYELPFDSERKMMTTVHDIDNKRISITKGAPDIIFSRCILTEAQKEKLNTINNDMSNQALRVLAVAYKEISTDDSLYSFDYLEKDLTFVGLVGMIDPARPEVLESIKLCKKAGITTVMITGDHLNTAVAIAKSLEIIDENNLYITGADLDNMSESEFLDKVKDIRVYARVSPENKVRIVSAWKSFGYVVAMTGDGVNDAPSIKRADIGIAMGITGTEVAKGAADMILIDDNFSTIVDAVSEGRAIFSNIKKAIHFLLSCNIGEIITIFLGSLIGIFIFGTQVTPLTAVQLLFCNLVTDSLIAIAIGLEPKEDDIMNQPPRDSKQSIFHGMWAYLLIQGIYIGIISFLAFTIGWFLSSGETVEVQTSIAETCAFIVLIASQLFHSFNVRSLKQSTFKLKKNNLLLLSFVVCSLLLLLVIFVPFLSTIFELHQISPILWIIMFSLSISPLILMELFKLIMHLVTRNKVNK